MPRGEVQPSESSWSYWAGVTWMVFAGIGAIFAFLPAVTIFLLPAAAGVVLIWVAPAVFFAHCFLDYRSQGGAAIATLASALVAGSLAANGYPNQAIVALVFEAVSLLGFIDLRRQEIRREGGPDGMRGLGALAPIIGFAERQLFGSGDRIVTWVWMTGVAWLILAICYTVVGIGFVLTIWLFPIGLAMALVGVCPSIWFVGQLWVWRSAFWTACSMLYGIGLAVALFNLRGATWGIEVWAALIPAALSLLAVWEMLRGPQRRSRYQI